MIHDIIRTPNGIFSSSDKYDEGFTQKDDK